MTAQSPHPAFPPMVRIANCLVCGSPLFLLVRFGSDWFVRCADRETDRPARGTLAPLMDVPRLPTQGVNDGLQATLARAMRIVPKLRV